MLSPISLRKILLLLLALVCLLVVTACGEKQKTSTDVQKAKVDAFRKHQKIEAIKAYTDLINKFPNSEHVAEAKERLKVLGPMPATPTPAKKQ